MRDRDQRLAAFAQRHAVEVHRAEFRHDPVHMPARGHHTGARLQRRHDARHGAVRRGGRQRDDGPAAAREGRAADEIHLPADAGKNPVPDAVGAHLAGEIDFDRGVDRHQLVQLPEQACVVRAVARVELNFGIVAHEVEHAPRAVHEARHDAVRVDCLESVCDRAGRVQIHEAVGKHLGVDAEVALFAEPREHRVGNRADAELEHRAVLHEVRDELPDACVGLRHRLRRMLHERAVRVDECRDALEPHMRRAMRARHLLVDFRDDDFRRVRRRARRVH